VRVTQDRAFARRWYTLGVLGLSLLVIVIDSTIVNVVVVVAAGCANCAAA
jgi:hypothetical protein